LKIAARLIQGEKWNPWASSTPGIDGHIQQGESTYSLGATVEAVAARERPGSEEEYKP